jgi:general secretion pathway protein G
VAVQPPKGRAGWSKDRLIHQRSLRRGEGAGGFTLIEILIVITILGIIATIVLPQFSNASNTARENMLKDELRYLRTQVIVYKAQHHDVNPGYPGGDTTKPATDTDLIQQMTLHTDEKGNVSATASATHKFGPYLSGMPPNPLTSYSAVRIVGDTEAWPTADDATYGWFYRPLTGELMANSTGVDGAGNGLHELLSTKVASCELPKEWSWIGRGGVMQDEAKIDLQRCGGEPARIHAG